LFENLDIIYLLIPKYFIWTQIQVSTDIMCTTCVHANLTVLNVYSNARSK